LDYGKGVRVKVEGKGCPILHLALLQNCYVMNALKITIIQSDLHWESIDANLAMFEEKIWKIDGKTDLIVLPEMFNTAFTMNTSLGEPMNSRTFRWMKQQASQTGASVIGSYIVREKGRYFNRLIWMNRDGSFEYYDKRHLFRMAGEHEHFANGDKKIIVQKDGWSISPLVCYDLRFPVWSRNRFESTFQKLGYDILIYVANWPEKRIAAWEILLQARAVENLCYVVGVNRTGQDGNGAAYNGSSAIINPLGEYVFRAKDEEVIHTETLDYNFLAKYRDVFPAYLDADNFEIGL
jgi:omega-amidase